MSLSSTEVEYRVMSKVVVELSWLIRLLANLGLHMSTSIPIHCDSLSALHTAKNLVFQECMKHIEVDCYFI